MAVAIWWSPSSPIHGRPIAVQPTAVPTAALTAGPSPQWRLWISRTTTCARSQAGNGGGMGGDHATMPPKTPRKYWLQCVQPVVWLGDMTRLATELGRWTAKLSLARLQQDAELPERAMEREKCVQRENQFQISNLFGVSCLDFSIMQPLKLLPRANVLGWLLGQTLWDAPAKRNVRFQGRIPRIGWKIERTHTNKLFLKGTTTVGGTKLFAQINPLTFCCQWWIMMNFFWKWRIGGFHHEKEERELGNLIGKY